MRRIIKKACLISILLTVPLITSPLMAQQRRVQAPKRPTAVQPTEPAPTFDTLLAAEQYRVYSEIRNVGTLVQSPALNDVLDPLVKLGGPPKEFKTILKWVNAHADDLVSSRMFAASWPGQPKLPNVLIAVEFSSVDEAKKFESELRGFIPKIMPAPASTPAAAGPHVSEPSGSPNSGDSGALNFHIKQAGSLLLLSDKPISFRELKPQGSRLLSEDPNFSVARNRFASESVFVYVDTKSIDRAQREIAQKYEEEEQRRIEAQAQAANQIKEETHSQPPPPDMTETIVVEETMQPPPTVEIEPQPPPQGNATLSRSPEERRSDIIMSASMSSIYSALFGGQSKWPEAVGVAMAFEGESYVARVLIINEPGSRGAAIPFFPSFISGPEFVPESAGIFPDNIDLFASASLDYSQIYQSILKTAATAEERARRYQPATLRASEQVPFESPFAVYEKKLGLKIKDDILPLLGNEVAVGLSWTAATPDSEEINPDTQAGKDEKRRTNSGPTPIIALAVKDRDAVRRLIPKIVESLAFKGANLLAQTEKRDDTEITTYANLLSYAFIGNFLVISTDPANTRRVVDSYLKQTTLSSNSSFRNFTRWQPRHVLGQVYVSPQVMDLYNPLGRDLTNVSDKMKEFMSRIGPNIEPTTYALSADGSGLLHEVRIPRNLLLLMIGGTVGGFGESPLRGNEAIATAALRTISAAQSSYQATVGNGNFGSIEQLTAENLISKDLIAGHGYQIHLNVAGKKFEATAVPLEYGTTGRMSFFMDESGVLRGGDHGGGPATLSDPPVR